MDGGTARTLGDVPRRQAALGGDRTALVFGGRRTSWAELDAGADRVAGALAAAGVGPGDRVAVLARDSDRVYELLFGAARVGAVTMGINWRLTAEEVRFILEDGEAVLLASEGAFAETVAAASAGNGRLATLVSLDGPREGWLDYGPWRDGATPPGEPHLADPEDVAVQMYTSGTTGHPKGVLLAHRSFFAVVDQLRAAGDPWIGWTPDDVTLYTIPSFHIGGLWWAMTAMNAGATSVVLPSFVAHETLEALVEHRVSKVCLVPAMIGVLLAEPGCEGADFSALEHIVYGGSPIPEPMLRRALDVFGCRFAQIYGLTETGNTAVCLAHDDHAGERLAAAGSPYPGVSLKVIDSAGAELPPRAVGEVCIRSPANMVGYWKRPEATAETLRDGWVHTGDAGFLDEGGCVFIRDRVKDMIISAGENVYPAEIESVLCGHPAVAEAAVIGVPHDTFGELVQALVVLKEGAEAAGADLVDHCRGRLADFKVPHRVEFLTALPRTPSGKIKKALLRRPYWEGRDRQVN